MALILLMAISMKSPSSNNDALPLLHINGTVADFGTVIAGSPLTVNFKVENKGTADLVIKQVSMSCSCTSTTHSRQTIKPGSNYVLTVQVATSGLSGKIHRTVRLFTNDQKNSEVLLSITGTIERPIDVDPSVVDFGTISDQIGLERKTIVQVTPPQVLNVGIVQHEVPCNVSIRPLLEGNSTKYELIVRNHEPFSNGITTGDVWIKGEKPRPFRVDVPIVATRKSQIEIAPSRIFLPHRIIEPFRYRVLVQRPKPNVKLTVKAFPEALKLNELSDSSKNDRFLVFELTIPPSFVASNASFVQVESYDGVKVEQTRVPVLSQTPPDLEILPEKVILPKPATGETIETITLWNNLAQPIRSVSAHSSGKSINVVLKETDPGRQYRATISVVPNVNADSKTVWIEFVVDNDANKKRRIPVLIRHAKATTGKNP